MNIGTRLFTWLTATRSAATRGNRYFVERRPRRGLRARRWVLYAGAPEASGVPPEWHAWLHYTTDAPLAERPRRPWQKPHVPNLTGTAEATSRPATTTSGGQRALATGDYEAWTPAPT